MKANLINKYNTVSKKTGQLVRVFVYKVVSATSDELADFEITQGVNYRIDEDGSPLFFTSNFEGNTVDLLKSKVRNRETGQLEEAYRVLSTEDFELKRSVITASVTAPVVRVAPKAAATKIDVSDDVDM